MKEFKPKNEFDDWNFDLWFTLDQEDFAGGWRLGQVKTRTEKNVGQDTEGRLILQHWVHRDKYKPYDFTCTYYALSFEEFLALLDRAIRQGAVPADEREEWIARAQAPFEAPWNIHERIVVYRDARYTLGQENDRPYLIADGKRYALTCSPYEPCLYIDDGSGIKTAVHNAFEPFGVLEAFHKGRTITSITGFEYDAADFCKMVEAAAGAVDLGIDDAERVFGGRAKKKAPPKAEPRILSIQTPLPVGEAAVFPEDTAVLREDPFYDRIAEYPDCAIDYCLVANEHVQAPGYNAHWAALVHACRKLFVDDNGEAIWHYDVGRADAKPIPTEALFTSAYPKDGLNYRKAFLYPPHENGYTGADFVKVNAALFPNGTDGLEAYEWTTDWSEYFDEGHEWWGALCLTVYDKSLDRFAVILASATD